MRYTEVGEWSGRTYPAGSVVVGYNGRKHARTAVTWAAAEAVARDAPLLVLFAANYPGMNVAPGPGLFHREPGALEAAEEVTARGVADALAAEPGVSVVGATEVTSPAEALITASRDAAAVVVGSRGYGRVLGALLGSVTFAVAARARCPVVVVKDDALDTPPGPGRPVVVGTDGSDTAEAAVDHAAARAAEAAAPLVVVTATGERQVDNVSEAELHAVAEQIAARTTARVRAGHPRLDVSTRVGHGPAEVALLEAAAGAGLLVVGTRGRGAFEGMLLGSVSHAVIHGSRCAVAVIDTETGDED